MAALQRFCQRAEPEYSTGGGSYLVGNGSEVMELSAYIYAFQEVLMSRTFVSLVVRPSRGELLGRRNLIQSLYESIGDGSGREESRKVCLGTSVE